MLRQLLVKVADGGFVVAEGEVGVGAGLEGGLDGCGGGAVFAEAGFLDEICVAAGLVFVERRTGGFGAHLVDDPAGFVH
jgi:hypothetical protein